MISVTSTTATLSWAPPVEFTGVTAYRVYDANGVVGVADPLLHTVGERIIYTVTGLLSATEYTLRVTALDAAGNESPACDAVTAITYFAAPENIAVTGSLIQVSVTWDAVDGADFYRVEVNGVEVGDVIETSYSLIPELTEGGVFTFRIKALTETLDGDWSGENSVRIYYACGGNVTEDTTFSETDLPYVAERDLTVDAGVTLTMTAGTLLLVNPVVKINVAGQMNVGGSDISGNVISSTRDADYGGGHHR